MTGDNGADIETAFAKIAAEREQYLGFKGAVLEELESATFGDALDLRRELRKIEDALRTLNVREHELKGKIKRAVAPRECKCPTCERHIPAGTVLTDRLREILGALPKS